MNTNGRITPCSRPAAGGRQRGATLFIVIVLVLLSMLLVLWASRTALFSELVVGNDADYQRALEAAQALIQDAQEDIEHNTWLTDKSEERLKNGGMPLPQSQEDFLVWSSEMENAVPAVCQSTENGQSCRIRCKDGLCLRPATDDEPFWEYPEEDLQAILKTGAPYGEYSGSSCNPTEDANCGNLQLDSARYSARYWIEPLDYRARNPALPASDMLFRITAIAFGRKGVQEDGDLSPTMAVLQTIVAFPPISGE